MLVVATFNGRNRKLGMMVLLDMMVRRILIVYLGRHLENLG